MFIRKLILCGLIFSYLAACNSSDRIIISSVQKSDKSVTSLRATYSKLDSIFMLLVKKHDFNGSLLVAKNQKILYQKYFGYSVFEKKDSLNAASLFQLASISKPITALAIIKLKLSGKLSYSDNIKKYIPTFPYDNITINDLLNHRSGLPNYIKMEYQTDLYDKMCNQNLLQYFIDYQPALNFEPNTDFQYSNTNYALLISLIEIISSQKIETFLEENIFASARMHYTFLYKTSSLLNTQGYYSKWKEAPKNQFDIVYGDKAVYSNISDLYHLDSALYQNSFIGAEEIINIFTTTSFKEYKFGWFVLNIENYGKILYHTGHWSGYNGLFLRDINNCNTIIMLCNVTNDNIYDYVVDILNIIENNRLKTSIKFY